MNKLDLTRLYKHCYAATLQPQMITVEKAQFLAIEGRGDPSAGDFAASVAALYSVAYAVKFMCKWDNRDFVVAKLEGQWWYDESRFAVASAGTAPAQVPRSEWEYRLLIRMPDYVNSGLVEEAIRQVVQKKKLQKTARVCFYEMEEGPSAQLLHTGPFDTEPASLAALHEFMTQNRLRRNGLHHEIYLSDFRKTPASKLRTILRQPVKPL